MPSSFIYSYPPLWSFRLLVIIIILLVSLERCLSDTVQITLSGLCNAATALVLILLDDADLLEGLEHLAVDGARGIDVVGGARAAVLGGTGQKVSASHSPLYRRWQLGIPMGLPQTADTDGLAHVDVTSDRGGANVEPIDVLGRQLLGVYTESMEVTLCHRLRGVRTRGLDPGKLSAHALQKDRNSLRVNPSCP
jgi:hypothetical protein